MKNVVIIPARYASTRLPRKLLLAETGKPLIQYTYEAALKATLPDSVSVACDHPEIFAAVKKFGGTVLMTSPNAQSGTDRIAEAAAKMDDVDIVVNVQGDEPEISGESIDRAIRMLTDNPAAVMATLATPIRNQQQLEDPACVKVVFDQTGRALYFSRSVIPHPRDGITAELFERQPPLFYQHIGLYAYRRDF
ncbi:MAG: 3-deoxy-manno-octulosonate cytidylyltransferase, partial [Planctomycetaceae bacterium]|nr:3-deoxy-manno-octulosonate cytidylyltransferase [Planctomycetaceae bacterium]